MAKTKRAVLRRKKIKRRPTRKLAFKHVFKNKLRVLYFGALFLTFGIGAFYAFRPEMLEAQLPSPPPDALYKQANQPINVRVNDLLSRMTLEEKIGQMALVDKNSIIKTEDISKYYLGGILSGAGAKPKVNTPKGWLDYVSGIKAQALKSRLGIPVFYGIDANHGHSNVLGATVFPHAIGLGASRDPALVQQVSKATAEELNATGINWSYSPSLDAPKDIRWGRVYEAFSEDPRLNSILGKAYVEGTQAPVGTTSSQAHVLASAKHFLGTGAMVWGESNHKRFSIDQGKTPADENALRTEYLPPYKAVINSDVASIMVGLNQWGDQRVIDSKYLLTDKLKNELGFKGFIVSDWYGVYEYSKTSTYRANINAINAGLDMAMLPYDYKDFIKDVKSAVERGEISESRINDAVSRILYQKFKAGLFDTKSNGVGIDQVGSPSHRAIARNAVASSAVLLKNEGSVLPLSKSNQHILVAGSGADNVGRQSGAWTVEWQGVDGNWIPGGTSILQGIRQGADNSSRIDYNLGGNFGSLDSKADVGIAVVSEKPYAEGWGDNENPSIEPGDLIAIENLKKSSNKVIVIIVSGRPLFIADQLPKWDGAVAVWLPGSEGAGVSDVLFGSQPFTGKLPVTWPSSLSQLPVSADGKTNDGNEPLFRRNFGL